MPIESLADLANPATAPRLVLKVGSALLCGRDGTPNRDWLATLAGEIGEAQAAGQKVICRSTAAGTNPNCVPYDLFGGTPSAAALNYVSGTGFIKGYTSEQVASATLTGSLGDYGIQSPWASDGINVALGVEYRHEKLQLQPDNEFETGDLTGQGAPTKYTEGSYKVTEFFGELTGITSVMTGI